MGATPKRFSATRRIQQYAGRLIRINTALNLNFLRHGELGATKQVRFYYQQYTLYLPTPLDTPTLPTIDTLPLLLHLINMYLSGRP